ncbi:hypothetical protein NX059_004876 [Plenodomus lindquistii]|nr:hypothetical protein NX059_004876 [Plenodomus lindquistii]
MVGFLSQQVGLVTTNLEDPILTGRLASRREGMTRLNEQFAENGSAMYKFRLSRQGSTPPKRSKIRSKSRDHDPPEPRFLRRPSQSQQERLAQALISAINNGGAGHRMSVFGPFIHQVPARIGQNPALDAAVIVLLNVHASLAYREVAQAIVSPELYLRAIISLQTCLEHPQLGCSPNTLCASILLGLVEAFAGPRIGNRYITHVGGAGRLIELHGPKKYSDPFMKDMLLFSRGGIIITCMYARKSCLLVLPEWRDIAFDKTGLTNDECLHTDVMQSLAQLSQILHGLELSKRSFKSQASKQNHIQWSPAVKSSEAYTECGASKYQHQLRLGDLTMLESSQAPRHKLMFHQLQRFKNSLYILAGHMDAKLADGSTVTEGPSRERNGFVPTSYHFRNPRDMTAYSCFWSTFIMTNQLMMQFLPPDDMAIYGLQFECRAFALEICKTWDDTFANKPIGAFHTNLSFIVAFEYCTSEEREWILKCLNSLLDVQIEGGFRWTEETIRTMLNRLAGDAMDTSLMRANPADRLQ